MMGGQISNAAVSGTALTLHAGLTAPGAGGENITDMTTPTNPVIPSRVRFTAKSAGITVGGYAIVIGTNASGLPQSEEVALAACITNAVSATGKMLFATVTQVALVGTVAAGGTVEVTSIAGDANYTVGTPVYYNLEFGGIDAVTGNYIKVFANNVFTTSSGFNAGDANHDMEDAVSFVMEDIDADLSISDVTSG
jgi:hypothetical protein